MDPHSIISRGPHAVAEVVAHDADLVDLQYLGQSCARLARKAETYQDALQWSDVAVLCYKELAKSLEKGYLRHGAEITEHGIMLAMIHRYGSASPELRKYLDIVIDWCDALRREFTDEDDFRAARKQLQEPAILLQESLTLMKGIWLIGLLEPEYDRWFFAAGFSRELNPHRHHDPPCQSSKPRRIHQKSLRPHTPPGAPPLAAAIVGEVIVAAIASSWSDWAGLAAEQPAVRAAMSVLEAAAHDGSPDWPAALKRAFAAVPSAIDPFVQPDSQFHGFYDPITSLTCAVITTDEVYVAWVGGTVACLLSSGKVEQTTRPLTRYEKHRRAGLAHEDLEQIPEHMRDNIEAAMGPSTRENPSPELIVWPRLCSDQSLLLTSFGMMRLLQQRLPLPSELTGEAWLHAALSIDIDNFNDKGFPELGDRIGVLIVQA